METSINTVPTMSIKKKPGSSGNRNRMNWLLYQLFARHEFELCIESINKLASESTESSEAPLYFKGMISRMSGNISESFDLLKRCHAQNEQNPEYLKQIARALYLMGKPKSALEVANEALKAQPYDWELYLTKGLCFKAFKDYSSAIEALKTANTVTKHEATCLQLAKIYQLQKNTDAAIAVLTEAIDYSLESPEIYTELGLLCLQAGQTAPALQHLENSLKLDAKNEQSVLVLGSALQTKGEYEEAIAKYKTLANFNQNSGLLWNNIGMCYFGRQKYIAAVACLKKAFYLEPFEWTISYNLGVYHYTTEQFTSAFHFFNNAINLNPENSRAYMYLALSLYKLGDVKNCCLAFERGMKIDADYLLLINYAIILAKEEDFEKASKIFKQFEDKYRKLNSEARTEVAESYTILTSLFSML